MDRSRITSIGESGVARCADFLTRERSRVETDVLDARRASKRREEFLVVLAHELRGPLSAIRLAAGLALSSPNDHTRRRSVRRIERQAEHMSRLVDDVLNAARATPGMLALRLEKLELREIVEAAIDAVRPLIQAKHHVLTVSPELGSIPVVVDRVRMTQVLTNLLTNAAKYTPPQGRIELTARKDSRTLSISVRDSGVGLPRGARRQLFVMFSRLRETSDGQQGLGIGLALSRRMVQLHGGHIGVTSRGRGHGSCFVVRIPQD